MSATWGFLVLSALGCTSAPQSPTSDTGVVLDGTGADTVTGTATGDADDGDGNPTSSDSVADDTAAAGCADGLVDCDGVCVEGTCEFAVLSITPLASGGPNGAADWIAGGGQFEVHGVGFQTGMRLYLGDGRAPLWVIDATLARMQAPPAPAGVVDVRIEFEGSTGTTPGAFEYLRVPVDAAAPWEERSLVEPHGTVPAATVMADGSVMISGGIVAYEPVVVSATAERFAVGDTAAVQIEAPMSTARWNHDGVGLLDGRVALFGGAGIGTYAGCDNDVVDLFDPQTSTFTQAGAPVQSLAGPRATLLVDGRVLVLASETTTAQIFDPRTDTFTAVAGGPTIAYWQANQGLRYTARLRDGRVLVVTAQQTLAFDPDTDTFASLGPGIAFGPDSLITLPDGRVVALGGGITVEQQTAPQDQILAFDPASGGGFEPLPVALSAPRVASSAVLQRDGSILVIGGDTAALPYPFSCLDPNDVGTTAGVDRVDVVAGEVTEFPPLPGPLDVLAAATLRDGSAIVVGGGRCTDVAMPSPRLYFRPAEAAG